MSEAVSGCLVFASGVIWIYLVAARRRYRHGRYQFGGSGIANLSAQIVIFLCSENTFWVNKSQHG